MPCRIRPFVLVDVVLVRARSAIAVAAVRPDGIVMVVGVTPVLDARKRHRWATQKCIG